MTKWLYRSEAKGIQDYVLGTSRLREIAGASDLVNALADKAQEWLEDPRCAGAELIAAAAGGVMAVFTDRDALARFASAWPMYCARTRPGLAVTQAWVEFAGDAPDERAWRTLFERLEEDRMRPMVSLPEPGPLVERAGRTGLAAVDDPTGKALLDAPTGAKMVAWEGAEKRLEDRFDKLLLDGGRRFVRGTGEQDFDEGYVAIVHADGNGIGKRVRAMKTLTDLEALSKGLLHATEAATKRAIAHVAALRAKDRAWKRASHEVPMRAVVLGGDDLTMLTRAADALPFTWAFLKAFEHETQGLPGGPMTASAGIAMVKQAFPYHAAYDLAEELCTYAKKETRKNLAVKDKDAPTPAAVAFHRVTTAAVQPWRDICKAELAVAGTPDRLVGGPWTLTDGQWSLARLRHFASLIRDQAAPKGTLREWLTEVTFEAAPRKEADPEERLGDSRERALWKRMLDMVERNRDRDADRAVTREALEAALRDLSATRGAWRGHPTEDADHTTPVADALTWLSVDPDVAFEAEVKQ